MGGPAVVHGMVFVNSGYGQWGGKPGNMLLAFFSEMKVLAATDAEAERAHSKNTNAQSRSQHHGSQRSSTFQSLLSR